MLPKNCAINQKSKQWWHKLLCHCCQCMHPFQPRPRKCNWMPFLLLWWQDWSKHMAEFHSILNFLVREEPANMISKGKIVHTSEAAHLPIQTRSSQCAECRSAKEPQNDSILRLFSTTTFSTLTKWACAQTVRNHLLILLVYVQPKRAKLPLKGQWLLGVTTS